MGFTIREIVAECKFTSTLTVEALAQAIPPDASTHALLREAAGEVRVRERKLTLVVVIWLLIALHLYTTLSQGAVLAKPARAALHLARSRHPPAPR
jgi:hypothetical protein